MATLAKIQGRYKLKECAELLIPINKITAAEIGVNKNGHIHLCQQPLDGHQWKDKENEIWFCYWISKKKPEIKQKNHVSINDFKKKPMDLIMRDNTMATFYIKLIRDNKYKSGKMLLKKVN